MRPTVFALKLTLKGITDCLVIYQWHNIPLRQYYERFFERIYFIKHSGCLCAPTDQTREIVLTLEFLSSLRSLWNEQNFSSEFFYIFSLLKIKKFHFHCKNNFKFKIWFSNEIDFGFQFRIPLSEIIWIVCLNVCDLERFWQNFTPWNRWESQTTWVQVWPKYSRQNFSRFSRIIWKNRPGQKTKIVLLLGLIFHDYYKGLFF